MSQCNADNTYSQVRGYRKVCAFRMGKEKSERMRTQSGTDSTPVLFNGFYKSYGAWLLVPAHCNALSQAAV